MSVFKKIKSATATTCAFTTKILYVIILIPIALLACMCFWQFIYKQIDHAIPRPLGSELVYLGKTDGGSRFGDSDPYSVYYYGTNLEPEQMKDMFTAQYSPSETLVFKNATFTTAEGEFMFTYENASPFTTTKKYVISTGDWGYSLAKKYLKH